MGHHAGEQCELSRRKWDFTGITEAQQLGRAVHPLASREDPQTPSYVHIADRLAARYVCVWRGDVCACGVCLRQRAECSTHFGLSTVAGLPDNWLQGREVKWEVGQRSGNSASDYCRKKINHQAAVNGVIAPDNKWQISASDLVRASLLGRIHNCKYYTMSEATPMLRLHREMKLHSPWTGISVSSVGYVQSCPSYEITGLCLLHLNNNRKLRDVSQNAKEVLAQEGLHAECKAD